jgi:hypothetical protein
MNKAQITRLHRSKHSPYIYINNIQYKFNNLDYQSKLTLQYVKIGEYVYFHNTDNIIHKLRFVGNIDKLLISFVSNFL